MVDNNGVFVQSFDVTIARFWESVATHPDPIRRRDCHVIAQPFSVMHQGALFDADGQRHRHQLPWDIHLVGVVVLWPGYVEFKFINGRLRGVRFLS